MNDGLQKKVDRAINLIKAASRKATQEGEVIEICYSGGKDSDVILELTKMARVQHRAIYKATTLDPSGTITHVKGKDVEIVTPRRNFMTLLEINGHPSRQHRHCCRWLKEYKILSYAVLGIRADESTMRKKRYKEPEICKVYGKKKKVRQYLPILDWTLDDIKEFVQERNLKLAPVYYDENGKLDVTRRLGCIGCPMMSHPKRLAELKQHPNIVKLYIGGGRRYLARHPDNKISQICKDTYELFCCDVICDRGTTQFKEEFKDVDCKAYLEDYFGIKFKQ